MKMIAAAYGRLKANWHGCVRDKSEWHLCSTMSTTFMKISPVRNEAVEFVCNGLLGLTAYRRIRPSIFELLPLSSSVLDM